MSLLAVDALSITAPQAARPLVDGWSFALEREDGLAIVGESGSGKTQAALALLGLQARGLRVAGHARFEGAELIGAPVRVLNGVRGAGVGFVFQDPLASLNPYLRVGRQIGEVLEVHRGLTRAAAQTEARRLLEAVRIADAARRLAQYPHELSGGMRQRVMLAVALAARPRLLIADEPTTALDVTVRQQLVALLAELRRELGLALLLITHDLELVAALCERMLVVYAGQPMEQGRTARLLEAPTHPYTAALLRAQPRRRGADGAPLQAIPGALPSLRSALAGCAFAARCELALMHCAVRRPATQASGEALRRCHRPAADLGAR